MPGRPEFLKITYAVGLSAFLGYRTWKVVVGTRNSSCPHSVPSPVSISSLSQMSSSERTGCVIIKKEIAWNVFINITKKKEKEKKEGGGGGGEKEKKKKKKKLR